MSKRVLHTILALCVAGAVTGHAQRGPAPITTVQKAKAREILATLRGEIRARYYDPTFRGRDLDALFRTAEQKLESAATLPAAYAVIAQAVVDLDDSHTYFIPPDNNVEVEYGWQMSVIGEDCYVLAVKPGSDAEVKGLKAGDRVHGIEGLAPSRQSLWKIRYYFNRLNPRRVIKVDAQSPDAAPRTLEIQATITPLPPTHVDFESLMEGDLRGFAERASKPRNSVQRVGDIAIWRPAFDMPPNQVDREFDAAVRGASSLVLDMRGNPGGFVKTLEQLVGRLFDHEVKIADLKGRKSSNALVAKARKTPFKGKIVALVDSDSGSAAEMLARVLQIEKRAVVMGDRSSGSVMQGEIQTRLLEMPSGPADIRVLPFTFSVTNADVIMTDGKSLERVGVTPDEPARPTPQDLAGSLDPVLARAVTSLGGTLTAAAAGKLFPPEWR